MLRGKSQKELLQLSQQLIQPLLPHFYKGQAGKICVIGGCEDYTGAPYFSSHSSLLVGADLSHVICEKLAAPIIKTYSPDLMVHPYLYELNNYKPKNNQSQFNSELEKLKSNNSFEDILFNSNILNSIVDDEILPKILTLLERIDIVIIGPGFGRDILMLKTLIRLIEEIKVMNKPIIMDADALYLLSLNTNLIKNYKKAILTPNVMEFKRIANKLDIDINLNETNQEKIINETQLVSEKLGDLIIVRKGQCDIIANFKTFLISDFEASGKRVGGQGDTLTGSIATLVNWSNNYIDQFWDNKVELSQDDANLLACFAASSLVRKSSLKAFKKYERSLQTSNIHEFLNESYNELFGTSSKL
ncbi:unnamed protein product [Candida verbasci]|uniref:ATP-dependent (S)-NAD(P)H-hydrate dehydratase n=1 Tax=Candida verbasci TaxID=1227364 RepID=A0A9W4U1T5_9ASCO|nr:unnamed protein product [Candida verbasci]